jgi:tetratricopeptide (TPR) repeat protein
MRTFSRLLVTFAVAASLLAQPKVITDAKAKSKAGKHEEAVTMLEDALKANAKDAAVKKALADAYMAQGDFYMYNEQLPPFRKYPAALRSYRKTVEHDAKNETAKKNIATIEGIYKSMGRPIPQ